MKKAEIIKSKHVDHIENEKNILEKISHPFVVSAPFNLKVWSLIQDQAKKCLIMDFLGNSFMQL